jgi:hypothetical protein
MDAPPTAGEFNPDMVAYQRATHMDDRDNFAGIVQDDPVPPFQIARRLIGWFIHRFRPLVTKRNA